MLKFYITSQYPFENALFLNLQSFLVLFFFIMKNWNLQKWLALLYVSHSQI